MIGYITLGTRDLKRASAFYDKLFEGMGAKRFMETPRVIAWSVGPDKPGFAVSIPYDGAPATAGNGVMIALAMDSREKVDAFYAKALELGASDEGEPGERFPGFYAGYFRDLDGNKLNAFFMG